MGALMLRIVLVYATDKDAMTPAAAKDAKIHLVKRRNVRKTR